MQTRRCRATYLYGFSSFAWGSYKISLTSSVRTPPGEPRVVSTRLSSRARSPDFALSPKETKPSRLKSILFRGICGCSCWAALGKNV
jgi:hypothetical protein